MTSTRPVKTFAACLLAAGSFAVAAPAFAGSTPPPGPSAPGASTPAASAPTGAANQVIDLGVAAPTPELIGDFQATGFEDPTAVFAGYGFTTVPAFPLIANSVLYQVSGNADQQPDSAPSQRLESYSVVTATAEDMQPFLDTMVAALADPAQYEISNANGTDDTIQWVAADATPLDYGTLPSWSVQVLTDTAEPGPVMIQISYNYYELAAPVPMPAQLTTAHGEDAAALTAAGFVGTGFRFTAGINNFGGFPIDTTTLSFLAPGATFDVAATTACSQFGLTAAVNEYDEDSWVCETADNVEPSMRISARESYSNEADSLVDVDYSA